MKNTLKMHRQTCTVIASIIYYVYDKEYWSSNWTKWESVEKNAYKKKCPAKNGTRHNYQPFEWNINQGPLVPQETQNQTKPNQTEPISTPIGPSNSEPRNRQTEKHHISNGKSWNYFTQTHTHRERHTQKTFQTFSIKTVNDEKNFRFFVYRIILFYFLFILYTLGLGLGLW